MYLYGTPRSPGTLIATIVRLYLDKLSLSTEKLKHIATVYCVNNKTCIQVSIHTMQATRDHIRDIATNVIFIQNGLPLKKLLHKKSVKRPPARLNAHPYNWENSL